MAKGRVHTINLAVYPQVLTVAPGDTVRVVTEFDYVGPELLNARMISAIWHSTFFDPHDEIVRGNKTFTIPSSPPPGKHIKVTMDLLVPSGEVGTDYGLYSSIRDVPGPDIYTGYYPNIITIEEVVPEYKGTISKKELEYNESRASIPAYNIPQDKEGKVHIWGRNDMATNQKLGIHWIVKDPDGIVVEDYEDWEGWPNTDPGKTHEFISPGRFDLNKPGTWTIAISLAMSPDSPLTVASYAGTLCTVKEAPPEEYTLVVTIEPPGAGHVIYSPKAPYSPGTVVTLVATPYSGYEFDHWGGWPPYPGIQSTSSTLNLTMTDNWWVVAAFREVAPPPVYYTCPYCGATFASEAELNIHTSEVHAEQLIYENWLRTGGTGSIEYWRSIGSPLYYTPPEPEPVLKHHYKVTFIDGHTEIISWVPDPVSKPNLWDFVDRDEVASWEYLGLY